jgi:type II secretory ATPase GspE/PulE/Tfp pilus assembly ATPase PilB-like protein
VTAIPRFLDLKVDRFLLSSSLLAIIAQRLARKICSHCKTEYELTAKEKAVYSHFGIEAASGHRGKGCSKCSNTGYSGRIAISEILMIDDTIKELIFSGASTTAMTQAAIKNGMVPMQKEGVRQASLGITTLEEILRVAG